MSRPPLNLNPFGTNTTNETMSPIDSIPIEKKRQSLLNEHYQRIHQHHQCINHSKTEKKTYQGTRIQTHHCQTHHKKSNLSNGSNSSNSIEKKRNKNKKRKKTRNKTRQTHCRAILICLTTVNTDTCDVKEVLPEKESDKILRRFNGKVVDDSV